MTDTTFADFGALLDEFIDQYDIDLVDDLIACTVGADD